VVNGYKFCMVVEEPTSSAPASYKITADPQVPTGPTATGNRFFYTDSSLGTIKANEQTTAKATDHRFSVRASDFGFSSDGFESVCRISPFRFQI
jgi:hypothetical protein